LSSLGWDIGPAAYDIVYLYTKFDNSSANPEISLGPKNINESRDPDHAPF